jgi:hypothetical protein
MVCRVISSVTHTTSLVGALLLPWTKELENRLLVCKAKLPVIYRGTISVFVGGVHVEYMLSKINKKGCMYYVFCTLSLLPRTERACLQSNGIIRKEWDIACMDCTYNTNRL